MKKFLSVLAIIGFLILTPLYGDGDPLYPDWEWINGVWIYTGTEVPPPPPPPLPPSPK